MMTRHLVDPELLPALDTFPALDVSEASFRSLRVAMREFAVPEADYARTDVTIERLFIPGIAGAPQVPVILYRPLNEGLLPVLLHIHGGGYVFGAAAGSGPGCVRTAAEVGCIVVSVDYRLAPEAPAPAPLDDCFAALTWLHNEADRLQIDRRAIAVGGESAGGGLAAALALRAREQGSLPICFQLLIYPMIDDRTAARPNDNPNVGAFVWTHDANAFGWRALLGDDFGGDDVSPYAAAARATDLAGLPPAYVSVGSLDLFLEEDLAYANRLMRAGVTVELHVWPGAYHGFELATESSVAKRAEIERRQALKRAFTIALTL
jgi:acetyl esterase/lipase